MAWIVVYAQITALAYVVFFWPTFQDVIPSAASLEVEGEPIAIKLFLDRMQWNIHDNRK